ncbi:MAG: hypothetical protein JW843_03920 [Candidatus Aminicenantes bacterium]|nr:hypothetical protein [Candidatus Aminicenantes bacterium]
MARLRTLTIAGLIILTAATAGCKRTATEGFSPLGPSTFVLTFALNASPNVLMATGQRPTSTLTAAVTENNQPAAGRTVIFTIITGPGEFQNYLRRVAVTTDFNGIASVTYIGPTKFEINDDTTATIMGQLQTSTPQVIAKLVELTILFNW